MAFNTILKTVKQKITHYISMSTYILSIITCEFSGLTGIIAAIVKKIKPDTQTAGNYKNDAKVRKSVLFSL